MFEQENGMAFAGVILHDAEDVVHPAELALFNAALHHADLIQLPVFSFRRALSDVIAATYMDEFAEWHTRDLVVRENLTGIVTCAGVSACFSRRAIEGLRTKVGPVFDPANLTEDYDIAFRIAKLGMRERFVRFPSSFTIDISPDLGQPLYVERRSQPGNSSPTNSVQPIGNGRAGCSESCFRVGRPIIGRAPSVPATFCSAIARPLSPPR
jgi:adsorption protein B